MKYMIEVLIINTLRKFVLSIFFIVPVNPKTITFICNDGHLYSDSPKAITEYILEHKSRRYEVAWIFKNPKKFSDLKKKKIRLLDYSRFDSILYLMSSKIIVTNGELPKYIPFRKKQIIINTSSFGYSSLNKSAKPTNKDAFRTTSHFVSPSEEFSKHLSTDVLKYNRAVLKTGLPKNDILFAPISSYKSKIQTIYNIPKDKKIVLYNIDNFNQASLSETVFNLKALSAAIESKLKDNCHILIKVPPQLSKHVSIKGVTNVSLYPEPQELIAAADMLISDNSPLVWDFSLTYRPCFIYIPNAKDVNEHFFIAHTKLPISISTSHAMLLDNILKFDKANYKNTIFLHHKSMGSFENGTATKQIVSFIDGICYKK